MLCVLYKKFLSNENSIFSWFFGLLYAILSYYNIFFMTLDPNSILLFLTAISVGLIIGIERDMPNTWETPEQARSEIGWVRAYAFLAFFWGLMAYLDMRSWWGVWKYLWGFIAILFIAITHIHGAFRYNRTWIVSELAAMFCYILGIIILMGEWKMGILLAVLSLVMLSTRDYLASIPTKISRLELSNAIKFAVISLVMLPILPDHKYSIAELAGTFGSDMSLTHPILQMHFFNPHSIWFFVVVMAGVEFIGYILSKTLGNKGWALLSGAVWGLISSTAVTAAMTNKSHSVHGNATYSYVAATLVASSIMCFRVIVISWFYNPAILSTLLLPALGMFFWLLWSAWYFYRISRKSEHTKVEAGQQEYESPFEIGPAIKFALVILAIKFIAGVGLVYQNVIDPKIFYYALGAISGLADVDAITMDMWGKSLDGSLPLIVAATTILIAAISNNIVKASIAYRMGEKTFGKSVVIGFGIAIWLAVVALIVLNIWAFLR